MSLQWKFMVMVDISIRYNVLNIVYIIYDTESPYTWHVYNIIIKLRYLASFLKNKLSPGIHILTKLLIFHSITCLIIIALVNKKSSEYDHIYYN